MEGYVLDSDEPFIIPPRFDDYETIQIIGQGAFSVVTEVKNVKTEETFACKVIPRSLFKDKHDLARLEHELRIYEQIQHPGIAKHEKTIFTKDFIYLVMEYCPNGTLFEHIKRFKRLSDIEIYGYLNIIISALEYLHQKGIAHRDIKLENIVFSKNYMPKLIDFGLSVQSLHPDKKNALRETICGSLNYIAPEVLLGGKHDVFAADVWALGICTYAMCVGEFPYYGSTEQDIARTIIEKPVNIPSNVSPLLQKAISAMLTKDPTKRITLSKLHSMIPINLSYAHQNSGVTSAGNSFVRISNSTLQNKKLLVLKPNFPKFRVNMPGSTLNLRNQAFLPKRQRLY